MTLIVVLCLMVGALMIWSSVQGARKSLRCVVISPLLLMDWRAHRPGLIIIELRGADKTVASEALIVPIAQLNRLLRWTPPETTLVFCGRHEFDLRRADIESTLLNAGLSTVYILDQDPWWPLDQPLPDLGLHWEPHSTQRTL